MRPGIGSLKTPESTPNVISSSMTLNASVFKETLAQGWPHCDNTMVRANTAPAKTTTGILIRQKLTPIARSAITSLSNDIRLKAEIVAIRQAMGKVRTRNEGSRCITIVPREAKPIPRDTTKSTRRSISFVKMMKQSPTKLVQNGGRSSRKM